MSSSTKRLRAPLGGSLAQPGVQHLAGVGPGGQQRVVAEHLACSRRRRRASGLPWTSQIVESRSIVTAVEPGPAPSDQARRIVSAITASSWRTCPNVNARRNVPNVEGAITRNGSTCCGRTRRAACRRDRCATRPPGSPPPTCRILRPGRAPPTRPDQPHRRVHQRFEPEADHQRRRHDQPRVGDQRLVVEGHLDAVDRARYSTHWKCLPGCGPRRLRTPSSSQPREALSADTRPLSRLPHRWIEAKPKVGCSHWSGELTLSVELDEDGNPNRSEGA